MARPFSHVLWIGLALLLFGAALLLAGCAAGEFARAGYHYTISKR